MTPRVKQIPPEDTAMLRAVERLEAEIFPDPWSFSAVCSAAASPCTKLYAALTEQGELMGYCFVTQVMDTADLDNIAVSPAFRRQGVARALLDTAFAGMEADIHLEVRASNAPAIALYQKFGFTQCGIRKNYYENPREDALLMLKPNPVSP